MLQVPLNKSHIRRTIRPLYGWTQATPKAGFLDADWDRSVDIFPGMVAMRTSANNYTLIDDTGVPAGLHGMYVAPTYGVDEVADQGINALAVWVLGPDAEFEIDAPAFDDSQTYTVPADGTEEFLTYWDTGVDIGKLIPVGATKAAHTASTNPVARLIEVKSDSTIVIGGLQAGYTS